MHGAMLEKFPSAFWFFFYAAAFLFSLYLLSSMDIHSARRVIWNASGSVFGKITRRRASETDFQTLQKEGSPLAGTSVDKNDWDLISGHRDSHGSANDVAGVTDSGHFTDDEFLARFGGMGSHLVYWVQSIICKKTEGGSEYGVSVC